MIGYMANNVLPLRAGEVVRVYVASRHGPRFWTSVATLVVERVLDGLAVGLILAWLFLTLPIPRELRWPAIIFLARGPRRPWPRSPSSPSRPAAARALIRVVFTASGRLERRLPGRARHHERGTARACARAAISCPSRAASVAIWLVLALAVWTALHAAHLDLPLAASWAVLAFMGLGVSLPSSPGFVGVIQAATVAGARPLRRAAHGRPVLLAHLPRRPVLPGHPLRPRPPPRRAGELGGSRPRHRPPVASAPR